MAAADVELIRRLFEQDLDGEALARLYPAEFEVHDHDVPDAPEPYRGADGFARWLEDWGSAWESFSFDVEDYVDAGDRVVVIIRLTAKGRGSGVSLTRRDGMVWKLAGGRPVRLDYYGSADEALAAAEAAP